MSSWGAWTLSNNSMLSYQLYPSLQKTLHIFQTEIPVLHHRPKDHLSLRRALDLHRQVVVSSPATCYKNTCQSPAFLLPFRPPHSGRTQTCFANPTPHSTQLQIALAPPQLQQEGSLDSCNQPYAPLHPVIRVALFFRTRQSYHTGNPTHSRNMPEDHKQTIDILF